MNQEKSVPLGKYRHAIATANLLETKQILRNTGFSLYMDGYRLFDVAPVFNLVQLGSLEGHFCNLYTEPRYIAGLSIQLFTLLVGWILIPNEGWCRATTRVLKYQNQFAGFAIVRHDAFGIHSDELYMFAIVPELRRNGLGEWLLRMVLAELPSSHRLITHCLAQSRGMKRLLRKIGFIDQTGLCRTGVPNFVHRFAFS